MCMSGTEVSVDNSGNDRDDHYREVCRGMTEGLLVTVNDSGRANAPASEEMRVESSTTDGNVLLEGVSGTQYEIRHEEDNEPVLVEVINDGNGKHVSTIETIEMIGIRL